VSTGENVQGQSDELRRYTFFVAVNSTALFYANKTRSVNGFEAEDSPLANPVIYLLLTTRRLQGNVAMDPNPSAEKLIHLLNFVGFEDSVMGPGLKEAWSNIRMGAGYDYPVHIDCFENVLVQLSGRKRVKLWSPSR
jgi:hypothetical protein